MPTDRAHGKVVVGAAPEQVLAVLRDVESQPRWMREITSAEVLEEYEDGLVATAAFELVTKIGSDTYTLEYDHADDGLTWTLVEGGMLSGQDGAYRLVDVGGGRTEVRLELVVEHSIRAPRFIRHRVFNGFVSGALHGLKTYVEDEDPRRT